MIPNKTRYTRLALAILWGAASPWDTICAAPVEQAEATTVHTDLTAAQMFELAERAVQAGHADDAKQLYEALASDPDIDIRCEARFRHARLLTAAGQYSQASVLLRAILDERPNAYRVRLELARLFGVMGNERAALRELRQVSTASLPPDIAGVVRQYTKAYRSFKPIGASLEIGIVPDSNINRTTNAETLDTVIAPLQLSRDARERSGIGLKVGGQGYARLPLSDGFNGLVRISGQSNLYRASAFNDIALSTQAGLEWLQRKSVINPSIGRSYRWFGGDLYATTDTASLNIRRALGTRSQIEMDAAVGRATYRQNALQDATLYDLSFGYERAFSIRSGGSITVSGSRQIARDPGYGTTSGGLSGTYWHEVGKMTLFGSATVRRLGADARLLLFPRRRSDTYWRLGVGGTMRQLQLAGFSPVVRASRERNQSSVGLYDYRRNALELGITKAF